MIYLYAFLSLPLVLAIIYPVAIQYERGGWYRVLLVITVPAFVIDVIANFTTLAVLMWDFPRRGEWTFSMRLARLQHDTGWRGALVRPVVRYLDYFDPTGRHVA